jgi:uncharacterized phage protein (TIGR02218 family)
MTYHDDETSVEDSAPRDCYQFICSNGEVYHLTSGVQDVTIGSDVYEAGTISRGAVEVSTVSGAKELIITMDVKHALPQRYMTIGVPQRRIYVTLYRYQSNSGEAQVDWRGYLISMSVDRHVAKLVFPARSAEAYVRRLPVITAGRDCSHILYETGCGINRAAHAITRTVQSVNGREVTLSSALGTVDQWAQWGELVHSSGERMTIASQVGTVITMQLPIYELAAGDSVTIYAGCAHTIEVCSTKFANHLNFGGQPWMPRSNPFIPNGYGIVEQT